MPPDLQNYFLPSHDYYFMSQHIRRLERISILWKWMGFYHVYTFYTVLHLCTLHQMVPNSSHAYQWNLDGFQHYHYHYLLGCSCTTNLSIDHSSSSSSWSSTTMSIHQLLEVSMWSLVVVLRVGIRAFSSNDQLCGWAAVHRNGILKKRCQMGIPCWYHLHVLWLLGPPCSQRSSLRHSMVELEGSTVALLVRIWILSSSAGCNCLDDCCLHSEEKRIQKWSLD